MSPTLQPALERYADLTIRAGLNLQPDQRLLIVGPQGRGVDIHLAPFVRLLARSAYKTGARYVEVLWDDPQLRVLRLQEAPPHSFGEYPSWSAIARLEFLQHGDACLALFARDPDLFSGIDEDIVSSSVNAILTTMRPAVSYILRNAINWSVVSAPIPSWAAKVFPSVDARDQERRLWELILHLCRADLPDPVSIWRDLGRDLALRACYLTTKNYSSLAYTGPGTQLYVALPKGHIWHGGQVTGQNGVTFLPNIPTEEIYTLPHKGHVDGVVSSTKPLSYGGNAIESFRLTFSNGRVVDLAAQKGEAFLRKLIETDEGASRLGEVALVPHDSPVSQCGRILHNELYDENAASHLAFGNAYKFSLVGGEAMSDDQFSASGGNMSLVHVDFMIGSQEMDVDGVKDDGSKEAIMRHGLWAFGG